MADLVTVLVEVDPRHGFASASTWELPSEVLNGDDSACVECERTDGDLVVLGTVAPVVPVGRPDPWRTVRPQPAGVAGRVVMAHASCIEQIRRAEEALIDWVAASPLRQLRNGLHETNHGDVR